MGIESLGPAVEAFGYVKQDYFVFPNKHLLAAWYAPPEGLYELLPRLFVSGRVWGLDGFRVQGFGGLGKMRGSMSCCLDFSYQVGFEDGLR
jgi:hypothetical protein